MELNDVRTLAIQRLLSAFARNESDVKLINSAAETIFDMGYAHGMTEAFERVLAIKGDLIHD